MADYFNEHETHLWADAIALRIVDEMYSKDEFEEDYKALQGILRTLFLQNPWAIKKLIGTGIIEENYFEPLE